jgi:hypothetical protein
MASIDPITKTEIDAIPIDRKEEGVYLVEPFALHAETTDLKLETPIEDHLDPSVFMLVEQFISFDGGKTWTAWGSAGRWGGESVDEITGKPLTTMPQNPSKAIGGAALVLKDVLMTARITLTGGGATTGLKVVQGRDQAKVDEATNAGTVVIGTTVVDPDKVEP